MKKVSLFVIIAALSAQMAVGQRISRRVENSAEKALQSFSPHEAIPFNQVRKSGRPGFSASASDIEAVPMFSSVNVYSVLYSEQNCLIYNPDIDAIVFGFRGNPEELGNGNEICTAVSTDFGSSFTGSVTLPLLDGMNRLPSVAIYNPDGNTDPAAAMKVIATSITNGSEWLGTTYASAQWDDNNLQHQTIGLSLEVNSLMSLTMVEGGLAFGVSVAFNTDLTTCIPMIHRGVYNSATTRFDWDTIALPVSFFRTPTGQTYGFLSRPTIAFSPDGSVGYAMFIGSDSRAPLDDLTGYQPIVFKTTDLGVTWQKMAMLDLTNNPVMIGEGALSNGYWDRVWPLANTWNNPEPVFKPWFSEADIVVDVYGNLHIMALCQGTVSDHPDSTGFTYEFERGGLFEIYNVSQGDNWDVRYIDSLETRKVDPDLAGWFAGDDIGWGHRVQASRTADGTTLFCIWTDTDREFFGEETNLYPDLKGWGEMVGESRFTEAKWFTRGVESIYGTCFFSLVSPVTSGIVDGYGEKEYRIPVAITDIRTNNEPGLPVYYSFLKGIGFVNSEFLFIGIDEHLGFSFKISPNPVANYFAINLETDHQILFQMELSNVAGAIVKKQQFTAVAGKTSERINVGAIPAGLYFCTLRSEGGSLTRKIIVR